jgi:hypothetical protein
VVDQIDEVMKMIRATLGSASFYHESLADATLQVGKTKDEPLRQIVASLIATAREMANSNQALAVPTEHLQTADQSAAAEARRVTLRESNRRPHVSSQSPIFRPGIAAHDRRGEPDRQAVISTAR